MASENPTRQRLISAAARLLQRRGMAATGLHEVLETAGAPRGSLYHHFPGGKNELAAAAIRHSGERISSVMEAALASAPGTPAAIRQFAAFYDSALSASGYRDGCPVATTALEAAALGAAEVEEACAAAFTSWESLVAARLVADGHPQNEAENLAAFVVASLEGALLLARVRHSARPLYLTADYLEPLLRHPRLGNPRQGSG